MVSQAYFKTKKIQPKWNPDDDIYYSQYYGYINIS